MIVSAHQPHFLPWLGYLDKIARADVFVVMDDLQFEAQNFQNRNRVKVNNGTSWLTVPLVKGAQTDLICNKRISEPSSPKEDWRRRAWLTLNTHYGKAPHWGQYAPVLEDLLAKSHASLLALNLEILRLFLGWFDVKTPLVMASTLSLSGQKSMRILHMCERVGAKVYLSGAGGSRDYLDLPAFERAGVEVRFQSFAHPIYPQRYPDLGFIKNLAALDLLLNCGPESARILKGGE